MYFGFVTSHKMSFSCAGTSSSEMKLVKNLLRTRLKQSNLVNRPNISTENPKEDFNDTPFQLTTTSSSIFVFVFNIFGCYITF